MTNKFRKPKFAMIDNILTHKKINHVMQTFDPDLFKFKVSIQNQLGFSLNTNKKFLYK
jgi:hypothetical protein